ncbi:MAG: hypothetical protein VKJ46_10170 [Leptolyngbyaceae bacterium]|nr:hypothetical protein [Leptolyngbyaceae bacterium]
MTKGTADFWSEAIFTLKSPGTPVNLNNVLSAEKQIPDCIILESTEDIQRFLRFLFGFKFINRWLSLVLAPFFTGLVPSFAGLAVYV